MSKKKGHLLDYVGPIMLYFLASDSLERSRAGRLGNPWIRTPKLLPEALYEYYERSDFSVNAELARFLEKEHLRKFADCFEKIGGRAKYTFVSEKGKEKLKAECADIWEEFKLSVFEAMGLFRKCAESKK